MSTLLSSKNAVIYGAGGGLGAGVATTFAREGARVFLAGRTHAPLERVAAEVGSAGGSAEVAVLDVFDERAVEAHLDGVGRVDVSFNLVSRGDVQGRPLSEMSAADFMQPVRNGLLANFVTATAAARRMVEQGSGVILTVTSGTSTAAVPAMGGTGPADAAIESFLRCLAAEVGPAGVRVCGIWTAGVPETFARPDDTNETRGETAFTPEQIDELIGGMAMLRRAPRLAQVADTAAFLASDRAGGITAAIANVSCGLVSQR